MAELRIPVDEDASEVILSAEDILESLRAHELVSSASYEEGEFRVVPTIDEPFSFKLHLQDGTEKGNA